MYYSSAIKAIRDLNRVSKRSKLNTSACGQNLLEQACPETGCTSTGSDHVLMRQRRGTEPGRPVREARKASHFQPKRARLNRLVNRGHPPRIRTERAQHADFRGRLVLRTRQPGINALVQ